MRTQFFMHYVKSFKFRQPSAERLGKHQKAGPVMNPKKTTAPEEVFTIDLGGNDDIPGVTQLLRPKKLTPDSPNFKTLEPTRTGVKKEIEHHSPGMQTNQTAKPKSPSITLKQIGVIFEIRFEPEKDKPSTYRFSDVSSYSDKATPAWMRKLLAEMKFIPEPFLLKKEFTEFRGDLNAFVMECFGADMKHFVQMVHTTSPEKYTVLISQQSIAKHEVQVLEMLSVTAKGDGSEFSIELDLAS
jgi:hypothetical protein